MDPPYHQFFTDIALRTTNKELLFLKNKLDEQTQSVTQAKNAQTQANAKITWLTNDQAQMKKEITELKAQISQANVKEHQLTQQLTQADAKITWLTNDQTQLSKEIANMKTKQDQQT